MRTFFQMKIKSAACALTVLLVVVCLASVIAAGFVLACDRLVDELAFRSLDEISIRFSVCRERQH